MNYQRKEISVSEYFINIKIKKNYFIMLHQDKKFVYIDGEMRKFEQFFVWNEKNIYIMDNHRAALWCWLNELKNSKPKHFKLLHIDNHEDISPRGLGCGCELSADIEKMSLAEYLLFPHQRNELKPQPVFSCENFLRYFIKQCKKYCSLSDILISSASHCKNKPNISVDYQKLLKKYMTVAHGTGDCSLEMKRLRVDELMKTFYEDENANWIVDLDLDYFYNQETKIIDFNLAKEVMNKIKNWYDLGKICVLTVAWSPEYLVDMESERTKEGLKNAEQLNLIFCKIFNLRFPTL